jgi:hypothetical protein
VRFIGILNRYRENAARRDGIGGSPLLCRPAGAAVTDCVSGAGNGTLLTDQMFW